MLSDKRGSTGGSETFSTAIHLLIGTALFIIIAVFAMYFFTGEDIKVTFQEGKLDAEKISTRIVFSKTCLALNESYEFTWYESHNSKRNNTLVRAGIIDEDKFNAGRIHSCAPYNLTGEYNYTLTLSYLNSTVIDSFSVGEGTPNTCDSEDEVSIASEKNYPVLIYENGKKKNGKIEMLLKFCYKKE